MNKLRPSSEIIEILKNKMKELNLNQKELAEKTGVSTSAISRYFNGSRDFPINDAPVFAKALGIDLNYLLGITSPQSIDDIDFTGIDRIAAHYKGEEFSEESLNAIQDFVEYVRMKNNRNKK